MFVFVGGVGPQETKTDVPDAQCPACGSYSLHDKRIDQVGHLMHYQAALATAVATVAAMTLLFMPCTGAVRVFCAIDNRAQGKIFPCLQCVRLGLKAR
jgi:hypothetical protein